MKKYILVPIDKFNRMKETIGDSNENLTEEESENNKLKNSKQSEKDDGSTLTGAGQDNNKTLATEIIQSTLQPNDSGVTPHKQKSTKKDRQKSTEKDRGKVLILPPPGKPRKGQNINIFKDKKTDNWKTLWKGFK